MSGNIHIFVSGKGGVGKTVLLYCFFNILLEKDAGPAILDMNSTNHDIYNILVGSKRDVDLVSLEHSLTGKDTYYKTPDPHWRMYRRQYGYNSVGFAIDFWGHILRVKQDLPSNFHLLVDTNLHPLNLHHHGTDVTSTHIRSKITSIIKAIKGDGDDTRIYIWFVWSGLPLRLYAEGEPELAEINSIFSNRFNLIHVLNPSAFIPEGLSDSQPQVGLWRSWREIFGLEQEEDLPDALPFPAFNAVFGQNVDRANSIAINPFRDLVKQGHDKNKSRDLQELYTFVCNEILAIFNNNIPWNIIAMPRYYRNLHGYIDKAGAADGHGLQVEQLKQYTKGLQDDLASVLEKRRMLVTVR